MSGGRGNDRSLPEQLARALEQRPQAKRAFDHLPLEEARDLADWVESTDSSRHRAQRAEMVVDLVDHFASQRYIDLREEPSRVGKEHEA